MRVGEELLGSVEECHTRVRQAHATAGSVEQRYTQFTLQRAYLLGERGLSDSNPRRRLGKVQRASQNHKVVQLPQFHQICPQARIDKYIISISYETDLGLMDRSVAYCQMMLVRLTEERC